jgi:hypothetical protein
MLLQHVHIPFIQYFIFVYFVRIMKFLGMGMNVGKIATNIINVRP